MTNAGEGKFRKPSHDGGKIFEGRTVEPQLVGVDQEVRALFARSETTGAGHPKVGKTRLPGKLLQSPQGIVHVPAVGTGSPPVGAVVLAEEDVHGVRLDLFFHATVQAKTPISTSWMICGSCGLSDPSVRLEAMASRTSHPSTTCPKTL